MSKHIAADQYTVESLAAELTSAAYPVLLRGGVGGSWVELELGLWKSLAHALGQWAWKLPRAETADQFVNWQEGLVARLTDGAVFVAREQAIQESILKISSDLRVVFRSAVNRVCPEPSGGQILGANIS